MMRGRFVALATTLAVLVPVAAGAGLAESAQRVTLFVRPAVVGWTEAAVLFGTATGAGPQDVVGIESRECGSTIYRKIVEEHALSGGGYSSAVAPGVTATVRAVWQGARSTPVTIRQEARLTLERRRSGTGFLVAAISKRSLWRRAVDVQIRDTSSWRTVKRVRLTDSVRSTGAVSASEATFRLAVPAGSRLRAVLPVEQARPCYTRSVSRVIRA